MEFSRQEYWSGLPFPSPGLLLDPEIESGSPALQTNSLPFELLGKPNIYTYSFVDYDGYSISSKGFLPTVVDIMVI